MTPRERVLTALDHREPDRVPIDLGGNQTGIHKFAYQALVEHLGLEEEIGIMDAVQQLARPSEAVLERLRVDTRYVHAGAAAGFDGSIRIEERDGRVWHDLTDEFGIRWSMPEQTPLYMDITHHPLAEATIEELDDYPWPDGGDAGRFAGLRERALRIRNETPYALVSGISGVVYEICWYMRGLERWFMDMIEQPAFCEAMLDRTLRFWLDWFEAFLKEVGDLVDVVMIGDDIAGQAGPLFQPSFYKEIVKPRHKALVQFIRPRTTAKIWYHTCGGCKTYIPELLDNGIDILNPVQISATDMDPADLKASFGDRLCFWGGGIDAQHILPFAPPEKVREEVRKNLDAFKPGGGYIFNNVHNLQSGVPPENILAFYDAAHEFGGYAPLNESQKIGLYGIGLDTYWPQFAGLKERLLGYQATVKARLETFGAEVVDLGLIDEPVAAHAAGDRFRTEDVDAIFLFITTYALSSTVLPVVQRAGVPVIVLNLQPVAQLDYASFNALGDRGEMTGIWLEHCQACCAPEIACVFNRAGIDYHLVTGHLDDEEAWTEIRDWVEAIRVRNAMRDNRLGVLGHYYGGMLDVYSDMTQQSAVFGTHMELLEMCELRALRDGVSPEDVRQEVDRFREAFDVSAECDPAELERAAQTSVALRRLVERHDLGALAYYYEGQPGNEYENIVTSVIAGNTLLTGNGVPVAGECEIKNAQAMKIMDCLGTGGSFSELYLADFKDDVVYLGHDGPAHFAIAEGRVGLVPLPVYHGKPGQGLSIQMSVKHGPVTLLSVVQTSEKLFLLVAEGESVPGPVLQIGNTNSRYRFSCGAKNFLHDWSMAGPAHHCAIGLGHVAGKIERLGALLGLEVRRVG